MQTQVNLTWSFLLAFVVYIKNLVKLFKGFCHSYTSIEAYFETVHGHLLFICRREAYGETLKGLLSFICRTNEIYVESIVFICRTLGVYCEIVQLLLSFIIMQNLGNVWSCSQVSVTHMQNLGHLWSCSQAIIHMQIPKLFKCFFPENAQAFVFYLRAFLIHN